MFKLHATPALDAGELGALLLDRGEAARLIYCELPSSPEWGAASRALESWGFVAEGSVGDFVADGVDLRILVRRAPASS